MKIAFFGIGIGSKNKSNEWLEVWYPEPAYQIDIELNESLLNSIQANTIDASSNLKLAKTLSRSETENSVIFDESIKLLENQPPGLIITLMIEDKPPETTPECYLKLHCLSHCLVKPNQINLDGIFNHLKTIAWTNHGPIDATEIDDVITKMHLLGKRVDITSVDKFPKMTDYVVPPSVRIANTSRVRLGAYLGEGTTIMHEGFVNFNAGTEGPNMVEGRISAGVFCAKGTDIGGGASIMGTLSGGGKETISIGRGCLLGANSGIGISLGDNCIVEAGLYITAGTIVSVVDSMHKETNLKKARELSKANDLLFRRNSVSGQVECLRNKSTVALNSDLHKSN